MRRLCTLLVISLILGLLLPCAMSSATVTQVKVADSKSLTNAPANSPYETVTVTVTVDPSVTNWIALSNTDNLVMLPTGDNNNIPFSGTPQINHMNTDDYVVVTVTKGLAVSVSTTLDDNDAYNCRIGNQAVISGAYPSVRAVNCVDWSKNPPVAHVDNFAETGQLTSFFTANGKGDYTFKIDFMNKYGTAAGHGAVWLLMDVTEKVTAPIPIPDGQRQFSYQILGKAVTAVDPFDMLPIGADCCQSGGNTLGFQISLAQFSGPTDMYLAIYAPNLSPDIYIFDKGGNLAPLSKGLVPWRESVSGPISEKLFADFPVSQLPSGTYYLLLMVTPKNTFQSYHLWIASLVAPGACVPGAVPDGSAGYVNGKVIAPNATVVHEGQQYAEQLSVSGNALVGIIKNGQAYLYHPALGTAVLSDDKSRQAFGHFLAGVSVGVQDGPKSASAVNPLNPGHTVSLLTGMDISRLDDGSISLTNKTKRFMAVETDTGFTTLVKPREDYLETNLIKAFLRFYHHDLWGYQEMPLTANSKIQSYGSIFRAVRSRWADADVLQAYAQNKELFLATNSADAVYFILESIKRVVGIAIPELCLENAIAQVGIGGVENVVLTTIADREFPWSKYPDSTSWRLFKEYLYEIADAAIKCGAELVAPPVALAVFKTMDVISFIDWGLVDTVGVSLANTYLYKAYDVLTISNILPLSCTATGDLSLNESGEVFVNCIAEQNPVSINLISGFADLSGLGGPGNFQLAPWQGYLSNKTLVTPSRSGDIIVYFKATDDQGREGKATASITVKGEAFTVTGCTATGNLFTDQPGAITVSCTTTGDVASVAANLSPVGGPLAFALTNEGGGKWEGTTTVTPPHISYGNNGIFFTATDKTGSQFVVKTFIFINVKSAVCNDANVNGWWSMQTYFDMACTNTGGFPAYTWQFILSSPANKFYEQAGGVQGTWVLDHDKIAMTENYGGHCTFVGEIDTNCTRMKGTWTCPSGTSTRQGCWIATHGN